MQPRIEHYAFGSMTVEGEHYKDDLLIYGGQVAGSWWRTQGHFCQESDLDEVFEAKPQALVIGQGSSGLMRVSASVEARCKKLGIAFVAAPTEKAAQEYNRLVDAGMDVAGAFHLTC